MTSKPANHLRAPIAAAFVELMRKTFGAENVTVLYVKEGEVVLGRKP